jgi:hypothetical protein
VFCLTPGLDTSSIILISSLAKPPCSACCVALPAYTTPHVRSDNDIWCARVYQRRIIVGRDRGTVRDLSDARRRGVGFQEVHCGLRVIRIFPLIQGDVVFCRVQAAAHACHAIGAGERNPASKSIVERDMPLFNGACPGIGKNRCVSTGDCDYTLSTRGSGT